MFVFKIQCVRLYAVYYTEKYMALVKLNILTVMGAKYRR